MKIKNYKLEDLLVGKDFFDEKRNNMYKYFIYTILVLLILVFIFSYFFKIDLKVKCIGIVENKNNISVVKSNVSGKVISNNYETGDKIKKGDLIIKLDDSKLIENYEILNNKMKDSQNLYNYLKGLEYKPGTSIENYNLIKKDLSIKIKSENIKINKLKKEIEDAKKIYTLGGISKNSIIETENQYNILKNNKELLVNQMKNLRLNKLEELNNEIKNIKIELNNMEFQKENYYIKAPIDGIIEVVKKININDIIGSEVLVNIIPEENIYEVKIYIDEKNIEKINYDSKVNFTLKDNNDKEIYIKGKIKYISSTPQQLNGEIYYYIISNIEIPKNINLKIGKTIETSIIHGKKTILNYLRDYLKK